ncbi:hypothetical protein JSO59_002500 [Riemerella anatipestifer]|uniref:hypothetical protein n=1 Tax=Riemerella anatipestifer TaxID=34085 RepID=UPI0030C5A8BA
MIKKIIEQLEKDSKWNLLLLVIPFIIYFSYGIYNHSFVKKGNYTIGYVDKIYWPVVSYKKVNYSYTVNSINYKGTDIYDSHKKPLENKRYLIQFSLQDNEESDIFQDIPIPDSIKSAPAEGWKELPEWAKEKMKKYDR